MINLCLYKFHWDCGRMGSLEGLLFATPEEIESALGKEVYFGEVLGKHSEIYGTINLKDFEKLEIDNETVLKLYNVIDDRTLSGYNPFEYIEERNYGEK
jgi:hypothetical protein